ncbi:YHS domain protein [Rhodobacteraceae bacterium D3-12]|nr:YHS domain protein [Rhodobacteraceae bacterium D3-12]
MLTRRHLLVTAATLPLAALGSHVARAATAPVFANKGIAINGYDPVAYFTKQTHLAGSDQHALDWNGAWWLFSSAETREMFANTPKAYAPQYGGYCAFAMAHGAIAKTAPDAWTVYEGKLYLNYSTVVRGQWSEDIPGNIKRADAHWPGILDK